MKILNKSCIKWIATLLFAAAIGYASFSVLAKTILEYTAASYLFLVAFLGIFLFFYCVISQNWKKTRTKTTKAIFSLLWSFGFATFIFVTIAFGTYLKNRPVHMKEDVLYVHPKPKVAPAPEIKEVFDGSKNDPNVKEDTTKR
jgi:hypothetical protein